MVKLGALKAALILHQVADLLNYRPRDLSYIVYKIPPALKYKQFKIAKRSGGTRTINAPTDALKILQRRLAEYLQDCLEELEAAGLRRNSASKAFRRRCSILSNAKAHRGRRYVFNLDLEDFFPSIHLGRVRGFFIKDKHFALHDKVATILAQIACNDGRLPQGSPCSPVISNLIAHILDTHLVRLAAQNGCTYTRYADDLTFSTNRAVFPDAIAKEVAGVPHQWLPGDELEKVIEASGFKINGAKTRMQYHDSRQEVTGLVVNRKLNVRAEYRALVRQMTHRLIRTGEFHIIHRLAGANTVEVGSERQLHGMLGFVNQLDLHDYRRQLDALGLAAKTNHSPEEKVRVKLVNERLQSKENTYRRFLLYTQFYAASKPVIICEGPTDSVYLVHAIRSLAASLTVMATTSPKGDITMNVRLYRYLKRRKKRDAGKYSSIVSSTGRILELRGGGGEFVRFLKLYQAHVPKFVGPGGYEPVILLVDFDEGSKDLLAYIKNRLRISNPFAHPYIRLEKNLYVVPIPLPMGASAVKIEDLFDDTVKKTVVAGKSFDEKKSHQDHAFYGKTVFAHKVVKPNAATIDFSKFTPLLLNVSAAIEEHRKKYPKPASGGVAPVHP